MASFDAEDIALVRCSFRLASATEALAAAYLRRLFEFDRTLRRPFHGDMRQRGQRFIFTLGVIVTNREQFEDSAPHMRALGGRHLRYHVRDEHYAITAIAFIGTLATQLGEAFTDEMRVAWTRVFAAITSEIVAGARAAGTTLAAPEPAHPLEPVIGSAEAERHTA